MASSRVLLISDNDDEKVVTALADPALDVTRVTSIEAALAAGGEPEVIVVDIFGEHEETAEACRMLNETQAFEGVPVLALSVGDDVEERIHLLEAGVDDVISRPFDARELEARVEALALRYQRTRDRSAAEPQAPVITTRDSGAKRLVAVFSPKGGAGTTTVAVNVAAALANRNPGRVAIVDLDVQLGQVGTHLNIPARLSLADLSRDEIALRDPNVVLGYSDRHESSLAVFAAPTDPASGSAISEAVVEQLLTTVGAAFQLVVADAGSVLDARSRAVLSRATDIVIVVTPEFPALKAVRAVKDLLAAGTNESAETIYVLNQIFAREILRLRDIEDALETKIALTIPYDAFAFLKSVNEGVPVVIGAPRTAAGEALARLAGRLGGVEVVAAPVEARRNRGLGSLFGRG